MKLRSSYTPTCSFYRDFLFHKNRRLHSRLHGTDRSNKCDPSVYEEHNPTGLNGVKWLLNLKSYPAKFLSFSHIFLKIYSEKLHWASLASCGVIPITTHVYWCEVTLSFARILLSNYNTYFIYLEDKLKNNLTIWKIKK